jgi:ATP-binding cassette subfamily B protein
MVFDGQIIIPTFLAFIAYLAIIASPLWMMVNVLVQFVQADAALTRINEVIENTPEIKEIKDAISAKNLEGKIQFVDVNFGYTSAMVLKDLNFEILPGEKVALLGTTGSGKSTLISLLPRFYDPVSGKILIDGDDIRNYKIKELREQIGYVSQNIFLFNTSIKDNISFGKEEATIEEIKIAADSANIVDFIESLPDKYETIVGERGTQLSGGQKQRIAIARALLIKPKILILDDSTSSVDVETEFKIQSALKTLMQNRTTFIITQRISTIRDADKILVMDRGRIIGLGTHEELIEQNVLYKQIYETLFKKQKQLNSQIQLSKTEVMKHE